MQSNCKCVIESKLLKEIDQGGCFWWNTFPSMKIIDYNAQDWQGINVVDLRNGTCFHLDVDTPVLFDPSLKLVSDE